jgi:hypothetical protein
MILALLFCAVAVSQTDIKFDFNGGTASVLCSFFFAFFGVRAPPYVTLVSRVPRADRPRAGLLAGAPTGCNCGEVPADCSSCVTGINGWKCRPRDCTYCSHGINGFTCGGNNCSSCVYGINGWLCQPAASISICTLSFTNTVVAPVGWEVSARYEVDQQNDVAFAKLFVSSSLPLLGAQIRTAAGDVAWQIYPTTSAELGRPIFWARLPALTMYSYPGAAASCVETNVCVPFLL